jgi:hypothetical protein
MSAIKLLTLASKAFTGILVTSFSLALRSMKAVVLVRPRTKQTSVTAWTKSSD